MGDADKEKKAKLAEGGSPTANSVTVESIGKLHEIQAELNKINMRAGDEVLEVEKMFNVQRKPLLVRRNEVIGSIQQFWRTAFLIHPILGDRLSSEDEKILQYMVSLEVDEAKDVKSGFSIILDFSPNPYFDDEKLTKTYNFNEEGKLSIVCKTIKWKEGMDITNGNGRDKGAKRTYTSESFFTWFSENVPSDGRVDEIAEIIMDDLWTNPLRHFQNEVDAMGLYGEEEEKKGSGGGNEDFNEDENYGDEVVDDNDKEYREEYGDNEEEDDDMAGNSDANADTSKE